MQEGSGVTVAASIWRDILLHLHAHHTQTQYLEPSEFTRARIDPRTGNLLTAQSPPTRVSGEELFIKDTLPPHQRTGLR